MDYNSEQIEKDLENDEINIREAGFMRGYEDEEEDDSKEEEE